MNTTLSTGGVGTGVGEEGTVGEGVGDGVGEGVGDGVGEGVGHGVGVSTGDWSVCMGWLYPVA